MHGFTIRRSFQLPQFLAQGLLKFTVPYLEDISPNFVASWISDDEDFGLQLDMDNGILLYWNSLLVVILIW